MSDDVGQVERRGAVQVISINRPQARNALDAAVARLVAAAVERVAAELGPPVVLINNAGITRDNMLFKMTDDDWDTVMNVHLRGAFLMSRAVQSQMVEQKFGRIVNLSS
ncbi:MAG TPA: SDR family NAD(P)-dependent oxidoreductase, partial [Thermoleophilaceae bacterium]|nr:SDR family NAD(P)-dependent oxidoreductase [Thermoleophilaceae bacterium]